jgi:hypothetical protein
MGFILAAIAHLLDVYPALSLALPDPDDQPGEACRLLLRCGKIQLAEHLRGDTLTQ